MAAPKIQKIPVADRPTSSASAASRIQASLPSALRNIVRSGRQINAARNIAAADEKHLPTTVDAVDRLLSGGLPRGKLIELIGKLSCGRFSTLLASLAAATYSGESAALVDMGNGLEPRTARDLGVDLERLLWIRPPDIKLAMISAELALRAGISCVAVDLGMPPIPGGRGGEAGWLRLARAAADHHAVLLISTPYRVSSTAAAAVLTSSGTRTLWHHNNREPRLFLGLQGRLTLEKSRLTRKSGDDRFRFSTNEGHCLSTSCPAETEGVESHLPPPHAAIF